MALKALLLRSRLDAKKKELEDLRAKDTDFETREAELEAAVNEMTEETTEEDRQVVEGQVEAFNTEKETHEGKKSELESEIERIEGEIAEDEKRTSAPKNKNTGAHEEREESQNMVNRTRFFGMSIMERDAFFTREDVKDFLKRFRDLGAQQRSVSGAELLIPEVVLGLIRENIMQYSKLAKHVFVRQVSGKARENIMGTIPEAVWTEVIATLNELELKFNNAEVDGYMVGGFIAVHNSILQDSDINLATEIISALGQSIGLALDKAIVYGTGTKMPLGIMTRLAQTTKPTTYPTTARDWEDLSKTHIIPISEKTDAALFKSLVIACGNAKGTYSKGAKFWAMNEKTKTKLLANALTINAAGAIVSGVNGTMPVVGGAIEELWFMPDNVIVGGYGDLYLLAEREGTSVSKSEHIRFLQNQTVYKGLARYDGQPVIAEGFVAIGIDGVTPTADAVSFAEDKANANTAA